MNNHIELQVRCPLDERMKTVYYHAIPLSDKLLPAGCDDYHSSKVCEECKLKYLDEALAAFRSRLT